MNESFLEKRLIPTLKVMRQELEVGTGKLSSFTRDFSSIEEDQLELSKVIKKITKWSDRDSYLDQVIVPLEKIRDNLILYSGPEDLYQRCRGCPKYEIIQKEDGELDGHRCIIHPRCIYDSDVETVLKAAGIVPWIEKLEETTKLHNAYIMTNKECFVENRERISKLLHRIGILERNLDRKMKEPTKRIEAVALDSLNEDQKIRQRITTIEDESLQENRDLIDKIARRVTTLHNTIQTLDGILGKELWTNRPSREDFEELKKSHTTIDKYVEERLTSLMDRVGALEEKLK